MDVTLGRRSIVGCKTSAVSIACQNEQGIALLKKAWPDTSANDENFELVDHGHSSGV